jgi:hypothetical protein
MFNPYYLSCNWCAITTARNIVEIARIGKCWRAAPVLGAGDDGERLFFRRLRDSECIVLARLFALQGLTQIPKKQVPVDRYEEPIFDG